MPLSNTPWTTAGTVAGFAQAAPNPRLMEFADREIRRSHGVRALDLGCGAARNALPLARLGWRVMGLDLSWPMLAAAAERLGPTADMAGRVDLIASPMDCVPARDGSFDLVVAHGIWNLARSTAEFRRAVLEAARVARPGAALFVFTFSRHTIAERAQPVPGEEFVFTEFSGDPQVFLTAEQLARELHAAGFEPAPDMPIVEYNRPRPGALPRGGPVIYEGGFRIPNP